MAKEEIKNTTISDLKKTKQKIFKNHSHALLSYNFKLKTVKKINILKFKT